MREVKRKVSVDKPGSCFCCDRTVRKLGFTGKTCQKVGKVRLIVAFLVIIPSQLD